MVLFSKKNPTAFSLIFIFIISMIMSACSLPQMQSNAFINLELSARAGDDQVFQENDSDYKLVIDLRGEYQASQEIEFTQDVEVTFDNIPVGKLIWVEAHFYIKEELVYAGTSNQFVVRPGENSVTVELKKIHSVMFDANGGTCQIEAQRVLDGQKAFAPETEPSKEKDENYAYTFAGWFTSQDEGVTLSATPYNFETPVTGDLTLYAGWTAKPFFTVTFNANGGSNPPESQRVLSGEKALSPAESELPVKAGDSAHEYAFKGWYTSTDGGTTLSETPYDFETAVTGDITLYAKWAVLVQTDIVDVEIPVDQIEDISVAGPTDNNDGTYTFTAEEGYTSYLWKFDGLDKNPDTNVSYSTTNSFTTPDMSSGYYGAPGTYSVTLLATKTVNGVTKYYSYTTQIIKD